MDVLIDSAVIAEDQSCKIGEVTPCYDRDEAGVDLSCERYEESHLHDTRAIGFRTYQPDPTKNPGFEDEIQQDHACGDSLRDTHYHVLIIDLSCTHPATECAVN